MGHDRSRSRGARRSAGTLTALAGTRRGRAKPRAGPLRLLGGFDPIVLAYADRSAHLEPARARAVNAGGGLVRPTLVRDGRVVGTWRLTATDRRVEVAPFERLTDADVEDLERETRGLRLFLGTDLTLAVAAPREG